MRCEMANADFPRRAAQHRLRVQAEQLGLVMDDTAPFAFARQPIVDRRGALLGYEILERGMPASPAERTARTLLHALLDTPQLVPSGALCFINLPPTLLETGLPDAPPGTVLEVLETTEPSAALRAPLANLQAQGYGLALDDYALSPAWAPLFDGFDFIKLDVRALPSLSGLRLPPLPARTRWIAEKVETVEEVDRLSHLGIGLFQGFYFAEPELAKPGPQPQWSSTVLRLLTALDSPAVAFPALARLAGADPSLTLRLLRAASPLAYGPPDPALTLPKAFARLGLRALRRWLQLMLLVQAGVFSEVKLRWALERSCVAAEMAPELGLARDELYLLTLLSTADSLFNRPLADVLHGLPFEAPRIEAARQGHGSEGHLLKLIDKAEAGLPLAPALQAAYARGLKEADGLYALLRA